MHFKICRFPCALPGADLLPVKRFDSVAPIADGNAIAELCGEASGAVVITENPGDFGIHFRAAFLLGILKIP